MGITFVLGTVQILLLIAASIQDWKTNTVEHEFPILILVISFLHAGYLTIANDNPFIMLAYMGVALLGLSLGFAAWKYLDFGAQDAKILMGVAAFFTFSQFLGVYLPSLAVLLLINGLLLKRKLIHNKALVHVITAAFVLTLVLIKF